MSQGLAGWRGWGGEEQGGGRGGWVLGSLWARRALSGAVPLRGRLASPGPHQEPLPLCLSPVPPPQGFPGLTRRRLPSWPTRAALRPRDNGPASRLGTRARRARWEAAGSGSTLRPCPSGFGTVPKVTRDPGARPGEKEASGDRASLGDGDASGQGHTHGHTHTRTHTLPSSERCLPLEYSRPSADLPA